MPLPESIEAEGFVYIKHLGQGAYGTVDKVSRNGKEVALKYSTVRSLKDEAEFMATLEAHPRIVRFFESGETDDGYHWYTMEIHSGDLSYWLQRRDARLSLKLIVRQVLEGLIHLHSLGFIHTDTHLGNFGVIWDDQKTPRIVLTDFGLVDKIVDTRSNTRFSPVGDLSNFIHVFTGAVFSSFKLRPETPLRELMIEAIDNKSPRVLDYLLSVAYSQGLLRAIVKSWLPRASLSLFQLILAWTARLHNQTVAQAARTALEEMSTRQKSVRDLSAECLEYLCQAAGLWDNPEADPLFDPESAATLMRQAYWTKPVPEQIDRLCEYEPIVFHRDIFFVFPFGGTATSRLDVSRKTLVKPDGTVIKGHGLKYRDLDARKAVLLFPRAPTGQTIRDLIKTAQHRVDGQRSFVSVTYSGARDSVTMKLKDDTRVIDEPTVVLIENMSEFVLEIASDS